MRRFGYPNSALLETVAVIVVILGHFCSCPLVVWAGDTQGHWAFQPITRPAIPAVESESKVNPIDAFVNARLESDRIRPVQQASRDVLLRRLYFNLLGLPPSDHDREKFVSDGAVDAYERLVDRLLESPHYGERWARHWLDVARYAESQGYDRNVNWPHIWRYRDWVVRSFNQDLPYDDFLIQQLAGDELEEYSDDHIIATAFLAAARINADEVSVARQLNDLYVDIVNATSSALLGLTMACAQCHDHRMEPILVKDYYRLQAFFQRGMPGDIVLKSSQVPQEFHEAAGKRNKKTLVVQRRVISEAIDEEPDPIQRVLRQSPTDRSYEEESVYRLNSARLNIRVAGCNAFRIKKEEKEELAALKKTLDQHAANVKQVWGFYSPLTSPHELSVLPMNANFPLIHEKSELALRRAYLLDRGDPYSPVDIVEPGFPEVFGQSLSKAEIGDRPRTALARWITSPGNPLTARVWVNRIWQYHFGRGLVATPGNFGTHGASPTHPQLLDYLASELIDSGWSTKHIQRLIVLSQTYRRSATRHAASAEFDPENRLYWRWPSRRMEAEALRDTVLEAVGRLDTTLGGPSVALGQQTQRRSLYLFRRRGEPVESLSLFDTPVEMSESCSRRHVSTTSLQPLYLLNHQRFVELASVYGDMISREAGDDQVARVKLAFLKALSRLPSEDELHAAQAFLKPPVKTDFRPQVVNVEIPSGARVPLDGESVRWWQDHCVGDNKIADDVSQSMPSRQPQYVSKPTDKINGLPVIRFAGGAVGSADHLLEANDSDDLDIVDGYAAYAVVRYRGDGIGNGVIFCKGRNGGDDVGTLAVHRWCAVYPDNQGHIGIGQNIGGQWSDRIKSERKVDDHIPCLLEIHWDGNQLVLDVFDSKGRISHSQTPLKGSVDPGGAGRLGIGGYIDAFSPNGERFNGDIGELLIYRQALDEGQRKSIHRYVSQRWGMDTQSELSQTNPPEVLNEKLTKNLSLWLRADQGVVTNDAEANVATRTDHSIPLVLRGSSAGTTAYVDHTPDPDVARVTYYFDRPVTVAEIEMLVHQNGITQIEGFVGDSPDEMTSIGKAMVVGAARNQPFADERGAHVFQFEPSLVQPGRLFRFVVKETVQPDRYANYQAFPRTVDHERILAKSKVKPLSRWTLFCQALLNLNEFVYIP